MTSYDCYTDSSGCVVCPERPAQAYEPDRVEQRAVVGWNAGANSVDMLDGDIRVAFTMPDVTGVAIGFKGSRQRQTSPGLIEHGLYFSRGPSGALLAAVMERGVIMGGAFGRGIDDMFEVRRVAGVVTYSRNGAVFYLSQARSMGLKVVNACLYSTGDAVI